MTKKERVERCRLIRDRYLPTGILSAEDQADLLVVLATHPTLEEKVGCGVDHIYVARNKEKPTYGFFIVRTDGSDTDIGFTYPLKNKEESDRIAAYREAIYPQIVQFRCDNRPPYPDCEVDHHAPMTFKKIVSDFIKLHGKGDIGPTVDNQMGRRLADEEHEKLWQEYHQEHAVLRYLTKEQHKKETKKQYDK